MYEKDDLTMFSKNRGINFAPGRWRASEDDVVDEMPGWRKASNLGTTQKSQMGRSISSFDPKGYLTQRDFQDRSEDEEQPSAFARVSEANRRNKGLRGSIEQ